VIFFFRGLDIFNFTKFTRTFVFKKMFHSSLVQGRFSEYTPTATNKKKKLLLLILLMDDSKDDHRKIVNEEDHMLHMLNVNHTKRLLGELVNAAMQSTLHPGRGNAIGGIRTSRPRRPNTSHYERDLLRPEQFLLNTGHTIEEFNQLLEEMLQMPAGFNFRGPRNLKVMDPGSPANIAENATRRNRSDLRKLSSHQELYEALKFLRTTTDGGSRRNSEDTGVAKAALDDSLAWIYTLMLDPNHAPLSIRNAIRWPSRAERDKQRDALKNVYPGVCRFSTIVDGTKIPHMKNMYSPGHANHYNHKGYGTTVQVYTDLIGRIILLFFTQGNDNDRGDYNHSYFSQQHNNYLDRDEGVIGDGAYRGRKSPFAADENVKNVLVPYTVAELGHESVNASTRGDMLKYNRNIRKQRLVVENSIGAVKQWKIVQTPSRGDIYKQPHYFKLCAMLTTRLQVVRDRFPRSISRMQQKVMETWEQDMFEVNLNNINALDPDDARQYLDSYW